MKNCLYLALCLFVISFASCAENITQSPPAAVVEIIPTPPPPNQVWVTGYYSYKNHVFHWNQGEYRVPSKGKTSWNQGEYIKNIKGSYKYQQGTWK